MHWIDYLVVGLMLLLAGVIACWTRKFSSSVADFMAASRCAGRYLICNARGEAGFGAISAVALFELYSQAGFTYNWWNTLNMPVTLFLGLFGFIIYRYRETRVLTLAQFFEIRYSRNFRVFAGATSFLSGLINYGIFPAVSSRFFVYYCGFPQTVMMLGYHIPTFAIIMAIFLTVTVFITLAGGQLTIMVTDCVVGLLSGLFYLIVAISLMSIIHWNQISEALTATPPGESLINPFDSSGLKDFNIWYVAIGMISVIYSYMAWQGGHAFNSSAANPHEAKMGVILGNWRSMSLGVMFTLLGICGYACMKHPDFAAHASHVRNVINTISNPAIQKQMQIPVALGILLPIGIKGIFCSIMLFAWIACDGSYQHSWGSIFIQDMVLPFRKKPFTPEQHILLLRLAVIGVALFGFFFSLLFNQTEYVFMFFALTGAIYLGGAGSVIIGGLYWKKGTTAAAWASMITGSALAVSGIILKQIAPAFPVNGQTLYFFSMVAAVSVYVITSLLTCKEDFNMDRMLHRGKYKLEAGPESRGAEEPRGLWARMVGYDEEFSLGDKIMSGGIFGWSMVWFVVFLAGTIWNLISRWPSGWWSNYWHIVGILIPLATVAFTIVWFTIGGVRDMYRLFRDLGKVERNDLDDGMVVGHHNLDEE